ncbi:phosphomannomutase [Lelliottia amnigena]|uniref:phosphomannomutase n=1 Tax=Lelliottia amnigena TaxID=61646 RepID=UPI00192BBED7|nr:phosphomannomutase [Lelliottia amnigena]MBL5922246.1 phosphomannomutase [Lelliottia amnigena]
MDTKITISNSKIEFGTSGARGLVVDFSTEVVFSFVLNFIKHMEQSYSFSSVAIGIDNRPSSYSIAQACASAIQEAGYNVEYYGVLPTPALALQGIAHKIPSVMVTGSHIPFNRNGLKFYTPEGEINKQDELAICNNSFEFEFKPIDFPKLSESSKAKDFYIERYTKLFPENFLLGKKIGIYEHSSSGRDVYSKLFTRLGAEVKSLERSDIFVPIDTEAVSIVDRDKAREWSKRYGFDAIFSTDGDGDRPLVADESGEWLRGDILGLLCAHALNVEAIAIPISCNSAIEKSQYISKVIRTKIGSPYVIDAFSLLLQNHRTVAGFEANGGFLLGSGIHFNNEFLQALPTRDAVLPFLMLMYLAQTTPISTHVLQLPQRYSASNRVTDFSKEKCNSVLHSVLNNPSDFISKVLGVTVEVEGIDQTDGIKMALSSGDFVHLRPSGNAPEFRCYTESATVDNAEFNLKKIIDFLENYNKDIES